MEDKDLKAVLGRLDDLESGLDGPLALNKVPQGPSSRLDADTVDGFQAVSADKPGPNVLVATDSTGKLPAGVMADGMLMSLLWGADYV